MTLFDGRTGEILEPDPPKKRPKRFRRTTTVKVFQNGTPPVKPLVPGRPRPSSPPGPSSALIVGRLARQAAGDPAKFMRLVMRHLAREIGRRMG
jgi:hypothetical protein